MVGTDHSPAMIEVAEQTRLSGLDERISFVVGDVESLPFADGQFDAVACQQMLHHLPDIRPCIAEIGRVLRPNRRYDICRSLSRHNALEGPPRRREGIARSHRQHQAAEWEAADDFASHPT